ncbi:hypothetical protein CtesDRAFT_PD3212 [Comamonas testosteroni KF-1]|uniref:Uncharacterized protein n=1 Tax=Comamonas testosteroni (strain DSM 14576 / KF-1) TaxID=399795 RepID=B7X0T4_COMTK|nr:hypothetical protein CtesDRAFT_PD3212 [Comamonas testosteroni KF-1]
MSPACNLLRHTVIVLGFDGCADVFALCQSALLIHPADAACSCRRHVNHGRSCFRVCGKRGARPDFVTIGPMRAGSGYLSAKAFRISRIIRVAAVEVAGRHVMKLNASEVFVRSNNDHANGAVVCPFRHSIADFAPWRRRHCHGGGRCLCPPFVKACVSCSLFCCGDYLLVLHIGGSQNEKSPQPRAGVLVVRRLF